MTAEERDALINMIKEFAVDFRELHVESGSPGYRKLAAKIQYSAATVTRVFKGEKLPTWDVLEAMLEVYRCDEQTVTAWRKRWASIKRLSDPVLAGREPAAPAEAETGEEDSVEDPVEHVAKHHSGDVRHLRAL